MLTLKIKEENYRKFVEETSRKREDWIKSISDSAVVIMERQRYLMGMSKQGVLRRVSRMPDEFPHIPENH